MKICFSQPTKKKKYTPDFPIKKSFIVEAKGLFNSKDRKKHRLIKEQHPNYDIRFVFSNSKIKIGKKSKVNHLSYIGDSEIGKNTNIGAGTITCNYDGAKKNKTTIGDNVFVGSDVQLIAPVKIKDGSTIAAGTTITKDVDSNSLAISRTEQKSITSWERPKKK